MSWIAALLILVAPQIERLVTSDLGTGLNSQQVIERLNSLNASGLHTRAWGLGPGPTVTIAQVQQNPTLVDGYIAQYAQKFQEIENLIKPLHDQGFFVVFGAIEGGASDGQAYLYGRALARRLGASVDLFHIGNEINVRPLYVIWGWESDPAWTDWARVRAYVQSVHQGIKDERPGAVTAVELQATVIRELLEGPAQLGSITISDLSMFTPDLLQDFIGSSLIGESVIRDVLVPKIWESVPESHAWTQQQLGDFLMTYKQTRPQGNFEAEVLDLGSITDQVAYTVYPHYTKPEMIRWVDGQRVRGIHGELVGDIARRIKAVFPDKDVYVLETGYPAGPQALGFTPQKQAQYVAAAMDSAQAAGVKGYTHFRLYDPVDHEPPSPEQLQNPKVVEGFWGLFVAAAERPAAAVVRDRFSRWALKRYTVSLAAGMNMIHVPLKPPSADYRAKNLMADLGADWLIFYDPATAAFDLVTPADPDGDPRNVSIEGDKGYIFLVKQPVTYTFVGTGWPEQINLSAGQYDMIGLPVRPAGGAYMASRLLNDTGASLFIWRDAVAAQWKAYLPGAPDFELTGDLAYLLVNAPAGTLTLPGAAWEN